MKSIKKLTILGVVVYIILLSLCLNVEIKIKRNTPKPTVVEVHVDEPTYMYTWDDGTEDCY